MPGVTTSFETKFAQISDVHLSERIPALQPYKVGFQVIDKTDDDTRAVGISAYVMDENWLYIPVFFLDGKLKGTELLYVKNQDVMVPALDNWVNYLRNKGIASTGNPVDPTEPGATQDGLLRARPEDVTTYQPYGNSWSASKQASELNEDPNALIDGRTWDRLCSRMEGALTWERPDISDIRMFGKTAAQSFVDTFLQRPDFANLLFQFYDVDTIQKLAHECVLACECNPEDHDKEVRIYTRQDKEAADLSDDEKSMLQRQGVYIKDTRTNFSKIFQEEVKTGVLQNPKEAGIYDVLMGDGEYKTFIILFPEDISACPRGERSHHGGAPTKMIRKIALIDPDAPSEFTLEQQDKIFCKISSNPREIFKNTEKEPGKSATKESLLTKKWGQVMFTQGPSKCLVGRLAQQRKGASGLVITLEYPAGSPGYPMDFSDTQLPVFFTGEDGSLELRKNGLFVPTGCRIFTEFDPYAPVPSDSPDPKPGFIFGSPSDLWMVLEKTAGMHRMEVKTAGERYQIRFGDSYSQPMEKIAALEYLTVQHGIFAGQAVNILKEASRNKFGRAGFLLKHAAPYDIAAYGTSQAPFQGGPSGKQVATPIVSTVMQKGRVHDNSQALNQSVIQKATDASNAGIKEVFDVEVLKGLIDKADISEIRKDYISKMVSGLDAAGRMLFLLYWHMDSFEDRYGQDQLAELENNLREVFMQTGDLVLFLKEKSDAGSDVTENLFGLMSEEIGSSN